MGIRRKNLVGLVPCASGFHNLGIMELYQRRTAPYPIPSPMNRCSANL